MREETTQVGVSSRGMIYRTTIEVTGQVTKSFVDSSPFLFDAGPLFESSLLFFHERKKLNALPSRNIGIFRARIVI